MQRCCGEGAFVVTGMGECGAAAEMEVVDCDGGW